MEKVRSVYVGWRLVVFGFLITLLWSASVFSADLTLAWDPNSEPDLKGYSVYFRRDTPGPPYDVAGDLSLSELTNPRAPSFVVSGLEKGFRYYFTVTARDTAGNESTFSDAVCAYIGVTIAPCSAESPVAPVTPAPPVSGTVSGGGGSNDGGRCFISASSEANVPFFLFFVALAIIGCILTLATSARKNRITDM
jgi:hypothetical protein